MKSPPLFSSAMAEERFIIKAIKTRTGIRNFFIAILLIILHEKPPGYSL
jgi:hypothetical protein